MVLFSPFIRFILSGNLHLLNVNLVDTFPLVRTSPPSPCTSNFFFRINSQKVATFAKTTTFDAIPPAYCNFCHFLAVVLFVAKFCNRKQSRCQIYEGNVAMNWCVLDQGLVGCHQQNGWSPLEWASQCSKKETQGCSFLSPARPPHQGRSSSSSSQWPPWYQSKPFCIAPEAIKSFFLSPSRSEMFDRTKRPTSRPDSDRSSHPASAQGAHHGRWTWVVDLATPYYGLKNDTQNMFFSCSWNYHYLPPVSDASANLLAYIFLSLVTHLL